MCCAPREQRNKLSISPKSPIVASDAHALMDACADRGKLNDCERASVRNYMPCAIAARVCRNSIVLCLVFVIRQRSGGHKPQENVCLYF